MPELNDRSSFRRILRLSYTTAQLSIPLAVNYRPRRVLSTDRFIFDNASSILGPLAELISRVLYYYIEGRQALNPYVSHLIEPIHK
jgi:hypothetical protein